MAQLIARGKVVRGWLGIAIQDVTDELASSFGVREREGVLVADVMKGGPGEAAATQPPAKVLVALAPVGWEGEQPVRFRWEIQLVHSADNRQVTRVCDQLDGVAFDEAVAQVQEPLALALDRADESGHLATVEIALPLHRFDTDAQEWTPGLERPGRAHHRTRPMGTRRPVVVRDVDRVTPPPEWRERWKDVSRITQFNAMGLRTHERSPGYGWLRGAPPHMVPVLCGPVGDGEGYEVMVDVLDAGHAVALWSAAPHARDACGPACEELRREIDTLLAALGGAAQLPEAVRELRARAYDGRESGNGTAPGWGVPWAQRLVLLYDDADAALPVLGGAPVAGP